MTAAALSTDGPGVELADTARLLLADLRAEITRADTKASVLVAAFGMTGGLLGGFLVGQHWQPSSLDTTSRMLWWAGVLAFAVALGALLLTVLPRFRTSDWSPGRTLTYFGDIERAAAAGQLENALRLTARVPVAGALRALAETSRIAARKHLWIRISLLAYGMCAFLLPLALLLG